MARRLIEVCFKPLYHVLDWAQNTNELINCCISLYHINYFRNWYITLKIYLQKAEHSGIPAYIHQLPVTSFRTPPPYPSIQHRRKKQQQHEI